MPSQLLHTLLKYTIQHASCFSSAEYLTIFRDTLGISTLSPLYCQPLLPAGSNYCYGYYLVLRYRRLVAAISAPPVRRIFGYYIHSASYFVLAPAQTMHPYGQTVACLVYPPLEYGGGGPLSDDPFPRLL